MRRYCGWRTLAAGYSWSFLDRGYVNNAVIWEKRKSYYKNDLDSHPKTWFTYYKISSLLSPTQRHGLFATQRHGLFTTKSPRYQIPPKDMVYLLHNLFVIDSHPKTWFISYKISSLSIPTQRHRLFATKSPRHRFPPKDMIYLLQNLLAIESCKSQTKLFSKVSVQVVPKTQNVSAWMISNFFPLNWGSLLTRLNCHHKARSYKKKKKTAMKNVWENWLERT